MKQRYVLVNLSREQVDVLNKVLAIAISQWPAHLIDVDDDLLSLHAKAMSAQQELDR